MAVFVASPAARATSLRRVHPLVPAMCGAAALVSSAVAAASGLQPAEQRWLKAAWPVVLLGEESGLPLDVVVQPRLARELPPIGLAFVGGRCKLVFSMRDNPEVAAAESRIPPGLFDAAIGLMAAHELGHCARHVAGVWQAPGGASPPSGFSAAGLRGWRLEEGYADLVGLAWARRWHPQAYERLYAWLDAERRRDRLPGGTHDTVAWIERARDGRVLDGGTAFEAAARLAGAVAEGVE